MFYKGLQFFLTDALGSVLTDFSGASGTSAVSGNQTFGPYGNLQYFKGSMGTLKGFAGQYQDDLSGLDAFGARYYDHLVGTFLSADTVQGNLQGDDPYAYVNGNPETFSDPSGRLIISSCYTQGCGIYAIPHQPPSSWWQLLSTDPSQLQIPTGKLTGSSSPSSAAATADNNNSSVCLVLGCRVTVHIDTGSTLVHLPSQAQVLCFGGLAIACT